MSKRIYVGNLPFSSTERSLEELFGSHGEVSQVNIVKDRETGQSRGFAFVEMASGGDEAISTLQGHTLDGRQLNVNPARPRPDYQRR